MIRNFTYRDIEARILIDEGDELGLWIVEYDLPDGLVQRYVCGWPFPSRPIIRVPFTKILLRPLTGEILKTESKYFIEPRLEMFYNGMAETNRGTDIALNTVSGMVAALPEFGGDPFNLDKGHRVLNMDGSIRQPVVFDLNLVYTTNEAGDNGEIVVSLINWDDSGELAITYELKAENEETFSQVNADGHFSNLSQGVYIVRVTDTEGVYRDQKTQILAAEVL